METAFVFISRYCGGERGFRVVGIGSAESAERCSAEALVSVSVEGGRVRGVIVVPLWGVGLSGRGRS